MSYPNHVLREPLLRVVAPHSAHGGERLLMMCLALLIAAGVALLSIVTFSRGSHLALHLSTWPVARTAAVPARAFAAIFRQWHSRIIKGPLPDGRTCLVEGVSTARRLTSASPKKSTRGESDAWRSFFSGMLEGSSLDVLDSMLAERMASMDIRLVGMDDEFNALDFQEQFNITPVPPDPTPLSVACVIGNCSLVRLLLAHRADPNARSGCGWPPLHAMYSSRGQSPGMVGIAAADDLAITEALLDAGASPNVAGGKSQIPLLLFAAATTSPEVVRRLVERQADVNGRSNEGETALHTATVAANAAVIPSLLLLRADPFIRNKDGHNPRYIAKDAGHSECLYALRNATADQPFGTPSPKKIKPNEPCPCGSGQKYKKCCSPMR